MGSFVGNLFKSVNFILLLILLFFSSLSVSIASDLNAVRTSSTGYQPQFQVSGNKIYYVWHEYDGPFRQIFTAVMNIDGTDWKAENRTSGQFDKVFPQLHVVGKPYDSLYSNVRI